MAESRQERRKNNRPEQHDKQTCFKLNGVRKTYGVNRFPGKPFGECRHDWGEQSPRDWRTSCGKMDACKECVWRPALDIPQLTIRRGAVTAVVGFSGSGKSTLLNLLGLLDKPDRDYNSTPIVLRIGEDVYNYDELYEEESLKDRVRRRRFGFVFQAGHLLCHFSTVKNVALPLALNGVPRRERERTAQLLLDSIYFQKKQLRALPRELSGGEYQRVAVMRAISHDPDVVFTDEPTGNLDPLTGQAVMRQLLRWKESGPDRTLIMVTHKTEEAFMFGNDFIVLSGGLVSFRGRKDVDIKSGLDLSRRLEEGARSFREKTIAENAQ